MTEDIGDYKARDAYFTLPSVARTVWAQALRHCRRIGVDPGELHWIEPSAGAGVFLDTAPRCVRHLTAYDIHPLHPDITKADFLYTRLRTDRRIAVIGNPPFGRQGAMVAAFVNHAMRVVGAEFACFVSPHLMTHGFGQKRLLERLGVAESSRIAGDPFVLPNGKAYKLGAPSSCIIYAHANTAHANTHESVAMLET